MDKYSIEDLLGYAINKNAPGYGDELRAELTELRRQAAAWRRLCAIDKARQATHRRPMLPRGVMDEVNAVALGKDR